MTAIATIVGSGCAAAYLMRLAMKALGADVPGDVYGFEDTDWE